jgi:hypothetical protein
MAYGRKYGRRKSYGRRPSRAGRTSRPKRSVPVPRKKRASATRRNALAINSLARQQRMIKAMTYGSVQTGLHKLSLMQIQMSKDHPYLWDMTDFSRFQTFHPIGSGQHQRTGGQVYTLGTDPVTNTVGAVKHSYWQQDHETSPFFKDCNDVPDTGKYLPIYGEYNIRLNAYNVTQPITVTFHMFTARPLNFTGASTDLAEKLLPKCFPEFKGLSDPVGSIFPSQYFKLYRKKTVKIWPMHNAQNHDYIRTLKLCIRPKGERNQDKTVNVTPEDATAEEPDGNWAYSNCPITQPFWCCVTTDVPFATISDQQSNPYIHFTMTRKVVFRDHLGASGGKISMVGGTPATGKRARFL